MNGRRLAVIGAGFGGLSAACYLARDGNRVTIFEKNEQTGGRASVMHRDGFTFDMGPSWYLMPDVFERFFAEFGKSPSDYYELTKLSPQYQFLFPDGTSVTITDDFEETVETFESLEPGAGRQLRRYLEEATYRYTAGLDTFVYRNYDSVFDFFNPTLVRYGAAFNLLESMDGYVGKRFKNPKIHQLLQYSLVFLGGSPKKTPSIYSLLAHVDYRQGVFYPQGGMSAVVKGLEALAIELGVEIRLNEEVTGIESGRGRIRGLTTNRDSYPLDAVVSNADYAFTEMRLLDANSRSYPEQYWKKKTYAPSAFLIYLGLKKQLPGLLHHNLVIGDWYGHFDAIFEKKRWPEDPSYYVCVPSKTDPSVAPSGFENVFVLVPIANGLQATDDFKGAYAEKILAHLENRIGQSIREHIEVQELFSVEDFEQRYNAYAGNGLGGLAHTLGQTAVFRPPNRSKKVAGLYYAGAATVPGIGVQMCLISGKLAAERVRRDSGIRSIEAPSTQAGAVKAGNL